MQKSESHPPNDDSSATDTPRHIAQAFVSSSNARCRIPAHGNIFGDRNYLDHAQGVSRYPAARSMEAVTTGVNPASHDLQNHFVRSKNPFHPLNIAANPVYDAYNAASVSTA
jgi:hypothetical protein